eukprot:CAMPEP_0185774486 /NCGR_PEP_ID=MMETSP1174-20130828/78416_1 /TAXON_ID=35687 /ORGANISM="Dictyocha speculum, Strain CCMP1381" /LENGTH=59 /DNA_ID=CAMNT_0028461677 /DNA_START=86 /DNA_END=265 /DNA_ORIENTATION=+
MTEKRDQGTMIVGGYENTRKSESWLTSEVISARKTHAADASSTNLTAGTPFLYASLHIG